MAQLNLALKPLLEREINGIVMGVLEDGTPYLSGRSLAILCGTAASTIIHQEQQWREGKRDNKLAQFLIKEGVDRPSLPIVIQGRTGNATLHAYNDEICILFLSYYALYSDQTNETAKHNLHQMARKTLRDLIYETTGYIASNRWQQYHDRLTINNAPSGYFSIFLESATIVLSSIKAGLNVNAQTMPDISIGIHWGKYWTENGLSVKFGERIKHEHNFPDYFPQSKGNNKVAWVYPNESLAAFRQWFEHTYVPEHFPNYLNSKVRNGVLDDPMRKLILSAVTDSQHRKLNFTKDRQLTT